MSLIDQKLSVAHKLAIQAEVFSLNSQTKLAALLIDAHNAIQDSCEKGGFMDVFKPHCKGCESEIDQGDDYLVMNKDIGLHQKVALICGDCGVENIFVKATCNLFVDYEKYNKKHR